MAKRSPSARKLYRTIGYPLQAAGAWVVYVFFSALPVDWASGLGGWLGRSVGPRLGITRRAVKNLKRALPSLNDAERDAIIRDMWDNLGRIIGELPHVTEITKPGSRVEIVGEHLIEDCREEGTPCILFSGHLANWEVFAPTAEAHGLPYVQIYRAANNPYVDSMLRRVRGVDESDSVPKGPRGARAAVQVLRDGRRLGMLVDQKMNDGIPVPFFGQDAMTAPALADLSARYKCPAIPVRLERVGGCRFRVIFHTPLMAPDTGDRARDSAAMMRTVNGLLEAWIRDKPGQWLWLHNRWP